MDTLTLSDYHQRVIEFLRDSLEITVLDSYPDTDHFPDCSALLTVIDWDASPDHSVCGELSVVLNCAVLVVVPRSLPKPEIAVKDYAMYLSLKINDNTLGLPFEPARFISASPDPFAEVLDDYLVWSVNFAHRVRMGSHEEPAFDRPEKILVGVSPDNGPEHQDAYEVLHE